MRREALTELHIHLFDHYLWQETVEEVFGRRCYFETSYPPTRPGTYAFISWEEWLDDNPEWRVAADRRGIPYDFSSTFRIVVWLNSYTDWALSEGVVELIGLLEQGHAPELYTPTPEDLDDLEGQKDPLPLAILKLDQVNKVDRACYRPAPGDEKGFYIDHGPRCPGCLRIYERINWLNQQAIKDETN